jgi:hypothetical protein
MSSSADSAAAAAAASSFSVPAEADFHPAETNECAAEPFLHSSMTDEDDPAAHLNYAYLTSPTGAVVPHSWGERLESAEQPLHSVADPVAAEAHATQQAKAEQVEAQLSCNRNLAASSSVSIAQRCYTDALHCIFRFLVLKEFLGVLCCRAWRAAAYKGKPYVGGSSVCLKSELGLRSLCSSPLKRHIFSLTLPRNIQFNSLKRIRESLPHLLEMHLQCFPTNVPTSSPHPSSCFLAACHPSHWICWDTQKWPLSIYF